jgi:glutamate/tyrosine decarboxylase-like PLP-dependent enzyme
MNLKDRETMNSIRQMENEVIQMTIQLFNGTDNSVSGVEQTSGILT